MDAYDSVIKELQGLLDNVKTKKAKVENTAEVFDTARAHVGMLRMHAIQKGADTAVLYALAFQESMIDSMEELTKGTTTNLLADTVRVNVIDRVLATIHMVEKIKALESAVHDCGSCENKHTCDKSNEKDEAEQEHSWPPVTNTTVQ